MSNVQFDYDYILEDERVLLRPLQEQDFEHLLPFSQQEPELWKFSIQQAGGAEALQNYIQVATENRRKGMEYPFIVFDKQAQQYAGSTRFYDIQPLHQSLQLGYTWYGKAYQQTGLNRHCKFLLLQFAFETLTMERVEFRADFRNKRSIEAMKKIGCIEEGVLRSHLVLSDGSRRDSIILSILREEWHAAVKENLQAKLY